MDGLITSRSNPKIKFARALRERKQRQATGLLLIEGIQHIGSAMEAAAPLQAVYYAPDLLTSPYALELVRQLSERGVPCHATSAEVFFSIAEKENPQGILAIAQQSLTPLTKLNPVNFPWGVALVSPQDPGNVGSILRTIDAVGASGLLLLESSVDPYHPQAVRAGMGAHFWYPIATASFDQFVQWARKHHYHLYGSSARGEREVKQVEAYHCPLIVMLGSEREGLSAEQKSVCEVVLRLPMRGRISSLNLSVAAGVLLYAISERLKPET